MNAESRYRLQRHEMTLCAWIDAALIGVAVALGYWLLIVADAALLAGAVIQINILLRKEADQR